jgi:hypothetical protein
VAEVSRDAFSTRGDRITVHYDKDTPANASEVLGIDFLTGIGAIEDGARLTPDSLSERLGRALIASDDSLQEFVRRYAVIVNYGSREKS